MAKKVDYEDLFYRLLYSAIEYNGGNLSEVLDKIKANEKETKVIRQEMLWDEE